MSIVDGDSYASELDFFNMNLGKLTINMVPWCARLMYKKLEANGIFYLSVTGFCFIFF